MTTYLRLQFLRNTRYSGRKTEEKRGDARKTHKDIYQ